MPILQDQATTPSDLTSLSVAELHQLLAEKDILIAEREQIIAENHRSLKAKETHISLLEEQLRLARQRRFGSSSEKSTIQGDLFDEAELEQALSDIEQLQLEAEEKPEKKASRKKRKGLSKKLPRIRIDIPLSDEDKAGADRTFFTKVKEELDIIPAKAQVIEYWQEKAVFEQDNGEQIIKAAERTPHPLGKCMASVQLLAYILVSKYADALPLYRLEKILARYGGNLSRAAMANWIIRLDDVFKPLINLLHEHQLKGDYLQMDETRIQVLKEDGKIATSDKWMWLIRGGPPEKPAVLFHYDPTRCKEVPSHLLENYTGVLQADGYAGYDKVCKENALTRIGCWDHARRKFVEAGKAAPTTNNQNNKHSKADIAIAKIRKLYAIEKRISKLSPADKTQKRQELAQPVLDDLKAWLLNNTSRIPKDSLTAIAIRYTLNQWEYLIGYLADGKLNISNALAENAVRPFAVGRRNWLFADTTRGAQASATVYSLIETAKANNLEPFSYLRYVLTHIAAADTVEKIEALLPWNMKYH